ncbi:MAG: hypothetical protein ACRD0K_11660 [Egibacteraceae bacterium]
MTLRTRPGGAHEARRRLAKAREFLEIAEVAQSGGLHNGAANAAVAAGIGASDAICCIKLGKYSRAQAHSEAVTLLGQAEPAVERHLRRLLGWKDEAAYGMDDIPPQEASTALRHARVLVERAEAVVAEQFDSEL